MVRKRSKKKVNEASYDVTMTKDVAGSPDENEETVNANDATDAITKAQKNDPNKGRYDKVEVKKGTGTGRVRTEPDTISSTDAKTQGMSGFESIQYPYNVGVPVGFTPLIESLSKKLRESITTSIRYGRLHVQIPDATTMKSFVSELEKKASGRSKVKDYASVVSEGINRNLS